MKSYCSETKKNKRQYLDEQCITDIRMSYKILKHDFFLKGKTFLQKTMQL